MNCFRPPWFLFRGKSAQHDWWNKLKPILNSAINIERGRNFWASIYPLPYAGNVGRKIPANKQPQPPAGRLESVPFCPIKCKPSRHSWFDLLKDNINYSPAANVQFNYRLFNGRMVQTELDVTVLCNVCFTIVFCLLLNSPPVSTLLLLPTICDSIYRLESGRIAHYCHTGTCGFGTVTFPGP